MIETLKHILKISLEYIIKKGCKTFIIHKYKNTDIV